MEVQVCSPKKYSMNNSVSGKMPPEKSPRENYPPEICPPGKLPPGGIFPGDIFPGGIFPRTKNSYNQNIFYLNEKNIYDKNVDYWIQIFLTEWKCIFILWKKGHLMKIYFTECKFVLIEWKYIFISYEFLFLQHFSNHISEKKMMMKRCSIFHIDQKMVFEKFNSFLINFLRNSFGKINKLFRPWLKESIHQT